MNITYDKKDIAKRIYDAYPGKFDGIPMDGIEKMLDNFSDRFFIDDGIILMFAKLDQKTFEKMKRDKKIDVFNYKSLKILLEENGPHTFLLFLVGNGTRRIKRVFDNLRDRSISYYNRKMKLFIYERGGTKCLG